MNLIITRICNFQLLLKCHLKLVYKHHATCVLLAIQKFMLYYDREVTCNRPITNNIIQTTHCSKILQDSGFCNLAYFCMLLGLCYSTLQSLKDTQKEKYSTACIGNPVYMQ